jgi:holo-[acyl-carrier protein] synthase
MISGTGIDIVEIDRIQKSLEKGNGFIEKVFSAEEIAYCQRKSKPAESFAGRFAAKEAFFKAFGTGWAGEMAFNEVSVIADSNGKPVLKLLGNTRQIVNLEEASLHVSISHSANYATAIVIIETSVTNGNS